MKALEILIDLRDNFIYGELHGSIHEAINELQELENRSCSNCKYLCNITKECEEIDCPCFGLIINIDDLCDFYCNKWENKQ